MCIRLVPPSKKKILLPMTWQKKKEKKENDIRIGLKLTHFTSSYIKCVNFLNLNRNQEAVKDKF
jgi:hypothetical protein